MDKSRCSMKLPEDPPSTLNIGYYSDEKKLRVVWEHHGCNRDKGGITPPVVSPPHVQHPTTPHMPFFEEPLNAQVQTRQSLPRPLDPRNPVSSPRLLPSENHFLTPQSKQDKVNKQLNSSGSGVVPPTFTDEEFKHSVQQSTFICEICDRLLPSVQQLRVHFEWHYGNCIEVIDIS